MALFNRIRLDRTAIRSFLANPAGPVARFVQDLTHRSAQVARQEVHVRTGETLSSIAEDFYPGPTEREVFVGEVSASYAVFLLEKGVRPHLILSHGSYPMRGDVLYSYRAGGAPHFGEMVFGQVVHHPGYEPMPFLTTGLWSLQGQV